MRNKIYYIVFLCFLSINIFCQNTKVQGLITNIKGLALPGVSVFEKGTNNGTTSDLNGRFSFQSQSTKPILGFSYLGYITKEHVYNGEVDINVILIENTIELDEVVVTALGLERQTKSLGYAIQKLDAKDISQVKSANFIDNLGGKLAGVTVNQGATGIGSTTKITIRGEPSFTNNTPLIVVDGLPINGLTFLNFSNEAAAGFQEVDFGNGSMEMDADAVESVSVLKGPSAAALYGTRASNGVILIKTKDGSEYNGTQVSVNSSLFIDRAFQLPQFQNRYGQGNSGEFEFVNGLGAGVNDNITYSWGPELDVGTNISQFDSPVVLADGTTVRGGDVAVHGGSDILKSPFVSHADNLNNFYRTGITHLNNIAISSSNEYGSHRLSLADLNNKSIIPGSNLQRKTLMLRSSFNASDNLKVGVNLNYVNSKSDNRPAGGYGSENVNYSLVAWGPRSLNISNLKDYWQPGLDGLQQYSFNYTFFDNPYFILEENRNAFDRDRLFGNISAAYQLNENMSLMIRSGMENTEEKRTFRRAFSTNRFKSGGYAEHLISFREINSDFLLNYSDQFEYFDFDISIGGNRMDQSGKNVQSQALSLAQPGIFSLTNAASPLEVFQKNIKKRINSFYGLAKIGFENILYLDITARNDWSSALASTQTLGNVSFFYPSFSLSYLVSNSLELPEIISFAKVRASWAQVGNDTNPFQTSTSFLAQTPYLSQPTFTAENIIANSSLKPEQTSSIEIGTDLRLFDDRLGFDLTYFNSLTENQIISLPVSFASGFGTQIINGGEVRSQGVEIVATVIPVYSENYKWDLQLNFSKNKTTIEKLPEGINRLTLAYSRVYDNTNQTVWFQVDEGGQIGDFYGTGYSKNENGDFIIDNNGSFIADNNLKLLGNYTPNFILGINNSIQYKNFNLGFVGEWRYGGQLVSRTLSLAGVAGQLIETENRPEEGIVAQGVVNVGTTSEPIWQANDKPISAESYYRTYYDRNHEENNVYSASYFKLREMSLTYSFNTNNLPPFLDGISDLKIALIGRNLFAISEIPHFDPEQLAVQGQQFISGVEDMSYATTRSVGLTLSLKI